ncbi:hypothetical protein HBI04_237190 [Parastagonospora nodorum]|nr:hypothetical protein HBI95_119420 [Parastagonospora nodorum]KAH4253694.1 hypothetical protein HBI03_192330 [Parastagonospora nodorum]KAH4254486.1 hypothetical protein HBI04_237190 [Parastagonospora nodorum]KAH5413449.1 hypothetical protein HBI32_120710 [Parastagonospora nodorum]KAH5732436.1 hypothetical protein HBI17_211430 [Parastagonospora nodorum]
MTYMDSHCSSQFPTFANCGHQLPYEATFAALGGMRWSHSSATSESVRRRATERPTLDPSSFYTTDPSCRSRADLYLRHQATKNGTHQKPFLTTEYPRISLQTSMLESQKLTSFQKVIALVDQCCNL